MARALEAPGETALALGILGWDLALLGDVDAGIEVVIGSRDAERARETAAELAALRREGGRVGRVLEEPPLAVEATDVERETRRREDHRDREREDDQDLAARLALVVVRARRLVVGELDVVEESQTAEGGHDQHPNPVDSSRQKSEEVEGGLVGRVALLQL